MRVLLIEDAARLQRSLTAALRRSGYAVDNAVDGEQGLWLARSHDYDALIVDIMLPKLSGLDLLKTLRAEKRDTHVLLLTARDTVADRVKGLDAGADDYLVKPFALEELLARVNVLCRRAYKQKSPTLTIGDLEVDRSARKARRAGKEIELTAREYQLLEYLASRRGEVVSRTEVEEHIYDGQVDPMSNVVDSAICNLRKKISAERDGSALIHTRRGLGYVLEASASCGPSGEG